jgi:hypothetical protein
MKVDTRHVVPSMTHKSHYFHTAPIPRPEYLSAALTQRENITPWSRVLLEKLTGLWLVKKFPAFY